MKIYFPEDLDKQAMLEALIHVQVVFAWSGMQSHEINEIVERITGMSLDEVLQ